jgi:hypothetical protein
MNNICCNCTRDMWLLYKDSVYFFDTLTIEQFYYHLNNPVNNLNDMINLTSSFLHMVDHISSNILFEHISKCAFCCKECGSYVADFSNSTSCDTDEAVYYYTGLDVHQYECLKRLTMCLPEMIAIDTMIGMDNIKDELVRLLRYSTARDPVAMSNNQPLMHIVITGLPGHGKTEIAKLLGKAFLKTGLLTSDKFIIATRADLIGAFCGHTAKATTKAFDDARGGVIFIDEVYSLGNPDKKDVFTKECIDTINELLTLRNDTLCIIAGYEAEIKTCFFNYNSGLERRFPWRFNIEPYSVEDLVKIFYKKMNDMNISIQPYSLLPSDITAHVSKFSNAGGDIVNLVTNCMLAYYDNTFLQPHRNARIMNRDDVLLGLTRFISYKKDKVIIPPPAGMYT